MARSLILNYPQIFQIQLEKDRGRREMAEQTIIVNINGYWRDLNRLNILSTSGVFFVYEAAHNKNDNTVDLLKLIYIGASGNNLENALNYDDYMTWLNLIQPGHELCFSSASVDARSRERVMAAYIFYHKPKSNKEFCYQFPFDRTTVISTGKTALIQPVISLRPTLVDYFEPLTPVLRSEMIPVRAVHLGNQMNKDVG
jgi:hypothetical protein